MTIDPDSGEIEWTPNSIGEPAPVPFESNFYEFVEVTDPYAGSNNAWATVSAAASARVYNGRSGHLATIASQEENDFLLNLVSGGFSGFTGAWLGGKEPDGWLVGPEAGQDFGYTNWGGIEPNNVGYAYMNIGTLTFGIDPGTWADDSGVQGVPTPGSDPVIGYFVEYEGGTAESDVTVRVTDTGGLFATQSFTISIQPDPENDAPVIVSEPVRSIVVDGTYEYEVHAVDADGDAVTYSLATAPEGMAIDDSTGLIEWTPDSDFFTGNTVSYFDGTLDLADYVTTTITASVGATIIDTHQASGGNPGSYLNVLPKAMASRLTTLPYRREQFGSISEQERRMILAPRVRSCGLIFRWIPSTSAHRLPLAIRLDWLCGKMETFTSGASIKVCHPHGRRTP